MSKYGVIVCPKCGLAKGVEAKKKTTSCQCGKEIVLARTKLMFQTDSPLELADSVAKANAALRGGKELPKERKSRSKDPYSSIAERARAIKDPIERMRVIAIGLSELKEEFTIEDVRRVTHVLGKDAPEDVIARLQEHNLIYESGEGTYCSV